MQEAALCLLVAHMRVLKGKLHSMTTSVTLSSRASWQIAHTEQHQWTQQSLHGLQSTDKLALRMATAWVKLNIAIAVGKMCKEYKHVAPTGPFQLSLR